MKHDWQGKKICFAAINLQDVCKVPAALGDELALRAEVTELKLKFEDMTKLYLEVKHIADKVSEATQQINTLLSLQPGEGNTQCANTVTDENPLSSVEEKTVSEAIRPKSPILYSQITAGGLVTPVEPESNEGTWTTVTNKRKPTKSPKPKTGKPKVSKQKHLSIIGSASDTTIKSAPTNRERRGALFVTKCQPQTSCEDLENDIKSKVSIYNLHKVESVKTKFDTYTSFKVSFLLGDKKLNQFFREVIKPNMWGSGILVKPFNMAKMKKQQ